MYNSGDNDDIEYQLEVAKAIYIMGGVCIVFVAGLIVERTKPIPPLLPMHIETKGTI